MKRDMDLIRSILLDLESRDNLFDQSIPEIEGFEPHHVAYHLGLLEEAGLIRAIPIVNSYGAGWLPESITWAGHEFLDSAKDDDQWSKAKRLASDKGGALTFEAVKTALTEMTKRAVIFAITTNG